MQNLIPKKLEKAKDSSLFELDLQNFIYFTFTVMFNVLIDLMRTTVLIYVTKCQMLSLLL
jgi:hypothetical protein